MTYTPTQIADYYDAINCIEDIQYIAELLTDYPEMFDPKCINGYREVLKGYLRLWE